MRQKEMFIIDEPTDFSLGSGGAIWTDFYVKVDSSDSFSGGTAVNQGLVVLLRQQKASSPFLFFPPFFL